MPFPGSDIKGEQNNGVSEGLKTIVLTRIVSGLPVICNLVPFSKPTGLRLILFNLLFNVIFYILHCSGLEEADFASGLWNY